VVEFPQGASILHEASTKPWGLRAAPSGAFLLLKAAFMRGIFYHLLRFFQHPTVDISKPGKVVGALDKLLVRPFRVGFEVLKS